MLCLYSVPPSSCTVLYSFPVSVKGGSDFSTSLPTLAICYFPFIKNYGHLLDVKRYLTWVWVCIFVAHHDPGHHFMGSLALGHLLWKARLGATAGVLPGTVTACCPGQRWLIFPSFSGQSLRARAWDISPGLQPKDGGGSHT